MRMILKDVLLRSFTFWFVLYRLTVVTADARRGSETQGNRRQNILLPLWVFFFFLCFVFDFLIVLFLYFLCFSYRLCSLLFSSSSSSTLSLYLCLLSSFYFYFYSAYIFLLPHPAPHSTISTSTGLKRFLLYFYFNFIHVSIIPSSSTSSFIPLLLFFLVWLCCLHSPKLWRHS